MMSKCGVWKRNRSARVAPPPLRLDSLQDRRDEAGRRMGGVNLPKREDEEEGEEHVGKKQPLRDKPSDVLRSNGELPRFDDRTHLRHELIGDGAVDQAVVEREG